MATTTTNPRPCVSGDIGDTRTVVLSGITDLTGATGAVAHVAYAQDETDVATLDASVTDAVNREVTVELGTAVDDWLPAGPQLGSWLLRVEVTFGDGSVLSWPNGEPDTLVVGDSIG